MVQRLEEYSSASYLTAAFPLVSGYPGLEMKTLLYCTPVYTVLYSIKNSEYNCNSRGESLLIRLIITSHFHGLSPSFRLGLKSCLECWLVALSLFRMINYGSMSPEIAFTILPPWSKPNLEQSATVGNSKRGNEIGFLMASLRRCMKQTQTSILPLFFKTLLLFIRSVLSGSFVTPWTVARRAPLSMGFPRQEYWRELPFSFPRDLSNPGIALIWWLRW